MAAYHHVRNHRDTPGSLLIQHGSYQWSPWTISRASMPERSRFIGASDGPLGSATCDSSPKTLARERGNIANVPASPADMLSDSNLSFLNRRETAGVRDGSWLADVIATQAPD